MAANRSDVGDEECRIKRQSYGPAKSLGPLFRRLSATSATGFLLSELRFTTFS